VLRGFGGAGVLEVITDYSGDTFRAVYTLKTWVVFVLHAFRRSRRAENKLLAGTSNWLGNACARPNKWQEEESNEPQKAR